MITFFSAHPLNPPNNNKHFGSDRHLDSENDREMDLWGFGSLYLDSENDRKMDLWGFFPYWADMTESEHGDMVENEGNIFQSNLKRFDHVLN